MFPETQSFNTLGLSVFGLVLAMLGLLWLLVGGWFAGRARLRLALGLACLSGLAAALAAVLGVPAWLWRPLLALVPVGLLVALACSTAPARLGRPFARLIGRAPLQALVLLAAGLALAASQLWRIDDGLEREMTLTAAELSLLGEATDLDPTPTRLARTDAGNTVPLFAARAGARRDADRAAERRYLQQAKMELKLIQTALADPGYNCHGWVFASGHYWVRSTFVERILTDNRYESVSPVMPGDVAVFRNNSGEVTHSGVVRSVSEDGQVLVESKWGQLGRFIHTAEEHIYRGNKVTYYRSKRASHRLKGLSTSMSPSIRGGV